MRPLLLILVAVALLASSVAAQRSTVTVNSGSGDGKYKGQPAAHVWADPSQAGMVFDRWTGDAHLLQNPREWHTRLRTIKPEANITATYRPAPAWTPVYETLNMIQMGYYFPPNAQGVIFHFHGQGGSANLLFNNLERRIFANEAVAEGYAVVALDSADRMTRDWSTSNEISTSPDLQNVQAAISRLTQLGLMTAQTPKFAHGFSKGAGFAPRVSRAFGFRATSMTGLAGTPDIINITVTPTLWAIPQNDGTIMAGGIRQAYANYLNLVSRGVPAEHHAFYPSPVHAERFWRIPGLSASDSQSIHAALKQGNYLDGRNYLAADPDTSGWQSVIPAQYSSYTQLISEQLRICYAEHNFFSDYNRRTLDFFNRYLQ
jgi:hypothetical protein